MDKKEVELNIEGTVVIDESTYKNMCLKLEENSPSYLYLLMQKEKNIKNAIKYLEKKKNKK